MSPRDDVPNMENVNEQSFFHRNLRIPKNIQSHQHDSDLSSEGESTKLEGEVPVTFYHYLLHNGMFKYVVMPLQYLYQNYGLAMAQERFPRIDPPSLDEHTGQLLRIM